jgi:hypothetical protein
MTDISRRAVLDLDLVAALKMCDASSDTGGLVVLELPCPDLSFL